MLQAVAEKKISFIGRVELDRPIANCEKEIKPVLPATAFPVAFLAAFLDWQLGLVDYRDCRVAEIGTV